MEAATAPPQSLPRTALRERLAAHRVLAGAPPEELDWLAAHGYLAAFQRGAVIVSKGDSLEDTREDLQRLIGLWVVFSGRYTVYVDRGTGRRRVGDWGPGDISGVLPYSRINTSVGDNVVLEDGEIFIVPRDAFPEMIRECPTVTTSLVHVMLDRARLFTRSDLQDEKLLSLGRLSAGLAHELNNPASAAVRNAETLTGTVQDLVLASRGIGAARLSPEQESALDRFRAGCDEAAASGVGSPLDRSDREDAIEGWLAAHGADTAISVRLAEAGATPSMLDALAAEIGPAALNHALRWVAADCGTRTLVADIQHAATRIYDLVAAIKGYTYMDRTAARGPVNVADGLRDTVAVLRSKARSKDVEVRLDLPDGLPAVIGSGAELNQVWSNLIDNAIDAAPPGGHVLVAAAAELNMVTVRVVDDGPGITPDVRERIFEPFFTTKPLGQGTGLGLDLVKRFVQQHAGEIEVDTEEGGGRTEFRVILPSDQV